MIRTLRSNAQDENPQFVRVERQRMNNIALIEAALAAKQVPATAARTLILLVGGRNATSLRLRVAQSHVRHDLTPSAWSHAALLATPATSVAETPLYQISLEPRRGFGYAPPSNGIQEATLAEYRDARMYPNVAVISLPVPYEAAMATLERLRLQRTVIDFPELIVAWLGYAWGVGRAANPLFDGVGIPAAVLLESVLSAADAFELTPGLASRSSCPEAIYQAARWWHQFYAANTPAPADGGAQNASDRLPAGVWCATDALCIDPA